MYQRKYETKAGFYEDVQSSDHVLSPKRVLPIATPNGLSVNGPKISCLISPNPTDKELRFLQQMGVTHCFTWIENDQTTLEFLSDLKKIVEKFGLILYNIGNRSLGKNMHIILNTDKRDSEIERFISFLRMLDKIDVRLTTFTWEAFGVVYTTHRSVIRGKTVSRAVSQSILERLPPKLNKEYSESDLWQNLEYFLSKVLPYASKYNIRLALHPNDPPLDVIAGIPNLIRNRFAYDRLFARFANHPNLGMEFCCGCWLEGGTDKFGDLYRWIGEYSRMGKIFIVHLRNVTSPLPVFTETFIDEGYGDIHRIMDTLVTNQYNGTIILDHTPPFVVGNGAETAFSVGYMKAALRGAQSPKSKL